MGYAARVERIVSTVESQEADALRAEQELLSCEGETLREEDAALSLEKTGAEEEAAQRLNYSRILVEEESARVTELKVFTIHSLFRDRRPSNWI